MHLRGGFYRLQTWLGSCRLLRRESGALGHMRHKSCADTHSSLGLPKPQCLIAERMTQWQLVLLLLPRIIQHSTPPPCHHRCCYYTNTTILHHYYHYDYCYYCCCCYYNDNNTVTLPSPEQLLQLLVFLLLLSLQYCNTTSVLPLLLLLLRLPPPLPFYCCNPTATKLLLLVLPPPLTPTAQTVILYIPAPITTCGYGDIGSKGMNSTVRLLGLVSVLLLTPCEPWYKLFNLSVSQLPPL